MAIPPDATISANEPQWGEPASQIEQIARFATMPQELFKFQAN
jgi:hypothetical protein